MLLVLGPRWDSRQTKQKGNRQHRHTHLHAKMHSSSYFWLVQSSLRIAMPHDKELLGSFRGIHHATIGSHFIGRGCLSFVASSDFHSPLMIAARIFAPLLLLPDCSNA